MKVEELTPNNGFDILRVRVVSGGSTSSIRARGRYRKKREFLIGDASGKAVLTLWGEDAKEDIRVRKIYEIHDGWCTSYMGRTQVSLGKEGYIVEFEGDDPTIPSGRQLMEM